MGGASRLGHEHADWLCDSGTPELEHLVGLELVTLLTVAAGISHEPTSGKLSGSNPRSTQALKDKYDTVT